MKRGKNIGVYITTETHSAWSRHLSAKDLAMFMYPPNQEELDNQQATRDDLVLLLINMPVWWNDWYKSLSRADKYRFARVVEQRLREQNLIGGEE